MSEHAIEFLRGWIGEKVHCQPAPAKIEKQAETLAKECAAKAAEVGIPLEDLQEEVRRHSGAYCVEARRGG